MSSEQERLELRIQKLKDAEAQKHLQLEEAEQQLKIITRKNRNRRSIVGWTTLESVVIKLGQPVTFQTEEDIKKFLEQYVVGEKNRTVWGLTVVEKKDTPQKTKPAKAPKPKKSVTQKKAATFPDVDAITEQAVQGTMPHRAKKPLRERMDDDLEKEFL